MFLVDTSLEVAKVFMKRSNPGGIQNYSTRNEPEAVVSARPFLAFGFLKMILCGYIESYAYNYLPKLVHFVTSVTLWMSCLIEALPNIRNTFDISSLLYSKNLRDYIQLIFRTKIQHFQLGFARQKSEETRVQVRNFSNLHPRTNIGWTGQKF